MPFSGGDNDDVIIKADDGTTEGKKVSQVQDGSVSRLAVSTELNSITATPAIACVSNKLRLELSDNNININGTYTSIFSYSGSGRFFSAVINSDTDRMIVKLTADSEVIGEIEVKLLDKFEVFTHDNNTGTYLMFGLTHGHKDELVLNFVHSPLCFVTDIDISVKTSDGSNKKVKALTTSLTKET